MSPQGDPARVVNRITSIRQEHEGRAAEIGRRAANRELYLALERSEAECAQLRQQRDGLVRVAEYLLIRTRLAGDEAAELNKAVPAPQQWCVACEHGDHQQCLGGACQCIHSSSLGTAAGGHAPQPAPRREDEKEDL